MTPPLLSGAGRDGRGTRLLLADDDPDIRELLALFLQHHGYSVLTVADGHEAIIAAKAQTFDIAILDISMPGITGTVAASRLRQLHPGIGIGFHTAIEEHLVRDAFAAYDWYFRKPADLEDVANQLKGRDLAGELPV